MQMFSQWATKRVCKFFMKRLLGRILRSELDLEQLDVQLGSGKIQLKDLALNTDYLNDQLGETSLVIKEGLVGSITAKIPWKVLAAEACEIEVNDLELIVFPRVAAYHATCGGGETWGKTCINKELQPQDPHHHFSLSKGEGDLCGTGGGGCGGAYVGVDDGVRMIAKMVERVLLGLRVKVTNLTIVFQLQDLDGKNPIISQNHPRQHLVSTTLHWLPCHIAGPYLVKEIKMEI
jgi:autophagy-related protein 2